MFGEKCLATICEPSRKLQIERMSTLAERMVEKLETLVEENAGLQAVTVNGTSTTYADLVAQLDYWKKKQLRESGAAPRVKRMDLGGFH